jgi:hypothetical protein
LNLIIGIVFEGHQVLFNLSRTYPWIDVERELTSRRISLGISRAWSNIAIINGLDNDGYRRLHVFASLYIVRIYVPRRIEGQITCPETFKDVNG